MFLKWRRVFFLLHKTQRRIDSNLGMYSICEIFIGWGETARSQAAVGEEGADFLAISSLQLACCKAKLKKTALHDKVPRKSFINLFGVVTNPFELGPPDSAT